MFVLQLIGRKLARLASLAAQRRFIFKASASEYYLPEELFEDAVDALRLSEKTSELTAEARSALAELRKLLREAAPNFATPDFVETDPTWCSLRAGSRRCLDLIGFDLAGWEFRELSSQIKS